MGPDTIIQCPECGFEGSFIVGITGTATMRLAKVGGKASLYLKSQAYSIDHSDHYDCPGCSFQTYDMDDFFTRASISAGGGTLGAGL